VLPAITFADKDAQEESFFGKFHGLLA